MSKYEVVVGSATADSELRYLLSILTLAWKMNIFDEKEVYLNAMHSETVKRSEHNTTINEYREDFYTRTKRKAARYPLYVK